MYIMYAQCVNTHNQLICFIKLQRYDASTHNICKFTELERIDIQELLKHENLKI